MKNIEMQSAVRTMLDGDKVLNPSSLSSNQLLTFPLEKYLRNYLSTHLDEIEDGLKLIAAEYDTIDAGVIDIFCQDQDENFVVIELKRKIGTDKTIGQILRYMGWVKQNRKQNK